MSGKPGNLGQFWKELKRRRVIHVITVYASAAFVIIELVGNLTEPLNLPAGMSTIVIVVLAVGFPLVIILSWLYDLTSEGVEKTKPLSEIQEGEKTIVPNAWKIATYVSFALIIGLVVLNVLGGSKPLRAGDIQSLLILPFENFTGDDQLEWFVSAMHASLIQDMQRISGLRVICTTTSNVYKNTDMSASEIASELDVDAVMEAQVMCLGDSICTLFNLIQVSPEEKQVLTADIKEGKRQILSLYNRITKQISDKVKIELTAEEELLLAESREVDPDALDAYYKGLSYLDKINMNSLQKAKEYFNIAI
jgi:TolB-like protein